MKPIVYTTIFGSYDEPKPHPEMDADFVCITDDPNLRSDYWKMEVHREYMHLHPRMAGKIFKCLPPFKGRSLFIDGSIEIVDPNILGELGKYLNRGFAVYQHPSGRTCIESELRESLPMVKYQGLPLEEQVQHYFDEGLPRDYGLHACGVILRDGDHRELGRKWLLENFIWSYQDQLSLPYVRWKYNYKIDTIELDQYAQWNDPGSELFKIHSHSHDG